MRFRLRMPGGRRQASATLLGAARAADGALARHALAAGAHPDGARDSPHAPLTEFIRHGDREAVTMLLAHGARPGRKPYLPEYSLTGIAWPGAWQFTSHSPLSTAAACPERLGLLRLCLDQADTLDAEDYTGALHEAVHDGNDPGIEALLSAGANPRAEPAAGQAGTALHHACRRNQCTSARLLLRRGADPLRPDRDGRTPIETAANHVALGCTALLAASGAYGPGSIGAALARVLGSRLLFPCPSTADYAHWWARHGRGALGTGGARPTRAAVIARFLTELLHLIDLCQRHGAAIEDPRLALLQAASVTRNEIVCHLVRAGAPVDMPDSGGLTPLMLAARSAERLVRFGYTASRQHTLEDLDPLMATLLRAGADPHAADPQGATPSGRLRALPEARIPHTHAALRHVALRPPAAPSAPAPPCSSAPSL